MVTNDSDGGVIAVDLGKTNCRAVLLDADGSRRTVTQAGVLGAADGGVAAADRITATITQLSENGSRSAAMCGIGAAGILTTPAAGQHIATVVAAHTGCPTAVASDVITAHLGAFGGGTGAILVAGTGAVAVGINDAGDMCRIDGWGPDLGDLGSGSWLGREGVRAVLGAAVGRDPDTALTARLADLVPIAEAVGWVAGAANAGRQLATFAPAVLDEAERGDSVARGIVDGGIVQLTETARAAATFPPVSTVSAPLQTLPVALLGGLTQHPWFTSQLTQALRAAGLTLVDPLGDAVDGARIAATAHSLPHERYIHRA